MNFLLRFQEIFLGIFLLVKLALSKKYGLVEITSSNYESLVIDGEKDAWIVAVKGAGKVSLDAWRETEFNLRGLFVRVGIIDPEKDGAFLKRKGFLQKNKQYPVARVLPYGGYKVKSAGKKDVKTRLEAENFALESLPDETTKVKTMEELQQYVTRGYQATPLQMPVLLLTEKSTTSPLFRGITLKYSKYFNFGVMHKPNQEIKQNFQIGKIPAILVMVATESADKELIRFSSVFYDTKEYGEISYLNLTRFFFSVHEKHYLDHPTARKFKGKVGLREFFVEDVKEILAREPENTYQEDRDNAQEKEITFENHKRMCTDSSLGLCLIYFVDGKEKTSVEKALKLFKDLQKMPDIKDKPLHYLWVDASCHPEYGEVFGIFPDNLPVLLFAKPKKRLFKTLDGSLTKETVGEVISDIFLDRENLAPFSRFNEMLPVNCRKEQSANETSEKEIQDENSKTKEKSRKAKKTSRKEKEKDKRQKKTRKGDEL